MREGTFNFCHFKVTLEWTLTAKVTSRNTKYVTSLYPKVDSKVHSNLKLLREIDAKVASRNPKET